MRLQRAEQALLALAILYTFYFARSLILPVLIALLVAALLQPLVERLGRLHIPDPVGAGIVVMVFLVSFGVGVYYLSSPASTWLNRGPAVMRQVEEKVAKLKKPIEKAKAATDRIGAVADLGGNDGRQVVEKGPSLASQVVGGASSFLEHVAVVIILVYFLLAQGRTVLRRAASGFRDPSKGERMRAFLLRLQKDISAYLGTYAIVNIGVGLVVTGLMWILGMPSPYLWGVVAGCLNFIPYVGPATTLCIIALVSILSFDGLGRTVLPPLAYVCLTTLEGNFITPMIMGSRLAMNPLMVFVSIVVWGWVWGVPGIFLAVPILTTFKIVFDDLNLSPPIREVLKDEPAKPQGEK